MVRKVKKMLEVHEKVFSAAPIQRIVCIFFMARDQALLSVFVVRGQQSNPSRIAEKHITSVCPTPMQKLFPVGARVAFALHS
jgi:hypothetical protein